LSVTLSDVARRAGVSMKTVSRVINNEERVAETTREKVMAAIHDLGYVPNVWAQRLARGHSGLIGLLMYDATPAYIMNVMNGLMDIGDLTGYRISLYRLNVHDPQEVEQVIGFAAQRRVEAFVFTPPCDNSATLVRALQELKFPFVQLTPHERCSGCAWVSSSDESGSYQAAQHLIELGHTRIGFIKGNQDHIASRDRLQGYRRAMADHGLAVDEDLLRQGDWEFETGLDCARALLDLPDPPTAIMAANDDTAAGVIQAVWERGLTCPDDLSVIGYDDVPLARQVTPPLTTVRQPIYDIATTAMSMLVEKLIPGLATETAVEVPSQFIQRHSTGPLKRG
jgi:LacI family transcriptional regulator